MYRTIGAVIFFIVLLSSTLACAEINFLPVFNFDLSGGESYFENEHSSFGGNLNVDFIPAIRLSKKTSLLPRYSFIYQGVKAAYELEDRDFLYQQSQDHLVSLRLIHKFTPKFKIKTEYAFKKEIARETKDENWGDGLYDYKNKYGSLELEKMFNGRRIPWTIRAGVGSYSVFFPNYKSLASKFGQELCGEQVFNTHDTEVFVSGEVFFNDRIYMNWGLNSLESRYNDQKIVTLSGEYINETRTDQIGSLSYGISYTPDHIYQTWGQAAEFRSRAQLNIKVKNRISNQNHYDTENLIYIAKYYDYQQVKITPSIRFQFLPSNNELNFTYGYSNKEYPERIAQSNDGNYSKEKILSQGNLYNITFLYILSKGLSLSVSGSFQRITSNMKYEKLYKYNYNTANYLVGISYEY